MKVLPAFTIALALSAVLTRTLRASLVAELDSDYVTAAVSRGTPAAQVFWRHAFPNSLIPTINLLGVNLGWLISGTVVVETVFSVPGLGFLMTQSIFARDYMTVQAITMIFAVATVLITFAVDIVTVALLVYALLVLLLAAIGIGAGIFDHRQVLRPACLVHGQHDRYDERTVRPVALDLPDLIEIRLQRPVRNQLDVIKTDDTAVVTVDGAVARSTDIDDRRAFFSERLPDSAAPAGFEGTIDVVGFVGRRCRCEPERIR